MYTIFYHNKNAPQTHTHKCENEQRALAYGHAYLIQRVIAVGGAFLLLFIGQTGKL